MSIYSGFATRNQQESYDQLLFDLIQVLSTKILKTYNQQQTDEIKFKNILKKLFIKLSIMEKHKYLQPNFSSAVYQLLDYLLQQEKDDTIQNQNTKPKFWVKLQQNQDQNFTNDTHKNQNFSISTPKTSLNRQLHLKTPMENSEKNQCFPIRQQPQKQVISLKNKFNQSKSLLSRQKDIKKKHQSMSHFNETQQNYTALKKQGPFKSQVCVHCHQEKEFQKQKNRATVISNQKSDSLTKKQTHFRIVIPELVKQYLESTNQDYMKNFRKRKIKH